MKIKSGDNVIVISGKDKGKTGKVERALPREGRVVVSGVNTRKVHQRAKRRGASGEVIEKDMPVDVSNVMIADPSSGTPSRIGYEFKNGKKVRVAKKSGNEI